jgi:hypothetical protein
VYSYYDEEEEEEQRPNIAIANETFGEGSIEIPFPKT